MKHSIVLLIILILTLHSSCEKSPESSLSQLSSMSGCGGTQPDKSLPWLKNEIEKLSASPNCYSIARSTYKKETVFIISNCDPSASSVPLLYTCEGRKLNLTAEEYQNLNFTGNIELIWKNR